MASLAGKVIIVTGATGGIGFETVKNFLQLGAKVVMVDLDQQNLKSCYEILNSDSVTIINADVSKEKQVEQVVAQTYEKYKKIDVLFANAGVEGQANMLTDLTEQQFDHVLNVNVKGVWFFIKHAGRIMKNQKSGSIIVTSSVAGLRGAAMLGPYVTSKHALMGLVKSAAAELGPYQVRVNTINPGPVDNRMMRSIEQQFSSEHPEAIKEGFKSRIPIGRYAQNQDVASMAVFLASDESSYLTAGAFVVDGGFTAT